MSGTVINVTRFCTDDGPGIRTTVFFKGCPLSCIWCHNPESQSIKIENYINNEAVGKKIDSAEIVDEILKDKTFYQISGGGVTLSGGEPLFQADFAVEILKLCQENNIHTAVETSGYSSKQVFEKVLKFTDLVLFDIKETDPELHKKYTGASPDAILDNLSFLDNTGIPYILRAPIIPTLNDRKDHFDKLVELKNKLKNCKKIQIMPYHRLGEYKYELLGRNYECKNIQEPSAGTKSLWESYIK